MRLRQLLLKSIQKAKLESTIGALPTITNYRVKSEEYHAYFKEPTRPPVYLYLYYLDNPRKLFSVEEYHYENHKAILLLPVIFLPWILALAAMFLLNIPLPTR